MTGFAFGDVRLAGLIGIVAGSRGGAFALAAFFFGTLVGAALTGGTLRPDYLAVLLVSEGGPVNATVDLSGFPGWVGGTTVLTRYAYDPANVPGGGGSTTGDCSADELCGISPSRPPPINATASAITQVYQSRGERCQGATYAYSAA